MKTTLKLEEAAKFLFSYWMTLQLGFQWWVFFAWLLTPDISMVGYLLNTRTGGFMYNVFHHQGLAVLIWAAGIYFQNRELQFAGLLSFGHSSMDRVFGYGLKYMDDFKNTHLGWIGKGEN